MFKNIKQLPHYYLAGITIIIIWIIRLIYLQQNWTQFVLLIGGVIVGHLLMKINWAFLKSSLRSIMPLLLLPLTIFILTSTAGTFGKAVVVFFNLRLILDKNSTSTDN